MIINSTSWTIKEAENLAKGALGLETPTCEVWAVRAPPVSGCNKNQLFCRIQELINILA